MEPKISIVPNARALQLVFPVLDGKKVVDLSIIPITAWRIEYSEKEGEELMVFCTPISVEGIEDGYVIYDSDTEMWTDPEICTGKGLEELREHLESRI